MLKTKTMAARDGSAAYVTTGGEISGTVPVCAKHIFNKRCLSGEVLTDPIGSMVATDSTFSESGNGFLANTNAKLAVTSGSWGAFGTDDFLMVVSGQAKSTTNNVLRFSIGDPDLTAGASLVNNNSTATSTLSTDAGGGETDTITTLGALTLDTDYALFIAFDRDGNGQARRYTTAKAASASQDSALTTTASIALTPTDLIGLKGLIYGAGLYRFAGGLPANWVAWSIWLADQWRAGNYVVAPPAWRNL